MEEITELGPKQEAWMRKLETCGLPQAMRKLRTSTGFCCLGVLVEDELRWSGLNWVHGLDSNWSAPSKEKVEEMAFCDVDYFIRMNDEEQLTFAQIAERVRADPHLYFTRSV